MIFYQSQIAFAPKIGSNHTNMNSEKKRVAQLAQHAVCEAQETFKRLSRQIPFGVLKLASAFSTTCCQLVSEP
jgi:hypothetical protein